MSKSFKNFIWRLFNVQHKYFIDYIYNLYFLHHFPSTKHILSYISHISCHSSHYFSTIIERLVIKESYIPHVSMFWLMLKSLKDANWDKVIQYKEFVPLKVLCDYIKLKEIERIQINKNGMYRRNKKKSVWFE